MNNTNFFYFFLFVCLSLVLRRSQELRSQTLCAGASCGISSHFGTPITGMLFTIEMTPSYYSTQNYWFSALSSVTAAFIMRCITNM